jgi:hypothetical protein
MIDILKWSEPNRLFFGLSGAALKQSPVGFIPDIQN